MGAAIKSINGKPVFDAKRPVKLIVNARDVALADEKEPSGCAVARACRRELRCQEARVHLGRIYIRQNEGNWLRYETPAAMRNEIIAFDRGGKFEPGEFVLKPLLPSKRTGKKQGGEEAKGARALRKNKRKIAKPHAVMNVRSGPASGDLS